MSVEAAIRRTAYLVEGVTPADGGRLLWLDPDAGAVPSLEVAPEGPDRIFELSGPAVSDAGEGGCIPGRVRLAMSLRIRYRTAGSATGRAMQQARDAQLIRDALMFSPGEWDYPATGIENILTTAPQPVTPVLQPGQTAPAHEILTIPLALEVRP